MEIIEGHIPTETSWRGLFLLTSEEQFGKTWHLGLTLAQAHNGYLLTAVFCQQPAPAESNQARQLLENARLAAGELADYICPLIISSTHFGPDLKSLVTKADIDLVLAHLDGTTWRDLDHMGCAILAVRGDRANVNNPTDASETLHHILMPTSGGPNTVHALQFLLSLTPRVKITALYIARSYLGPHEESLGWTRLRQLIQFVDGGGRIESLVVTADSVAEGIVAAADECDLVLIGATQESSLDKVLFGDVPAAVIRRSKKPVMVVRQPRSRLGNRWAKLMWQLQRLLPPMNLAKRAEAYTRIRRGARPDIDFYMLISLAAIIAALGLMANSAAVVIGAMLVAPLMSPIVGMGLAVVLGDARFLRLTVGAVVKGALLAIFVGMLAGLLLVAMQLPLTDEILARTRPSLLDLGIALFSGLAAAYALSRSDAAGALPGVAIAAALVPPLATVGITLTAGFFWGSLGALLLFITNLVSISSATALMFLMLGFRPTRNQKARQTIQMRSVRIALLSLTAVTILLALLTYQLALTQSREARIVEVATIEVKDVTGGSLDTIEYDFVSDETGDNILEMDLIVRSTDLIVHSQVELLQQRIGTTLQNEGIAEQIALTMSVIRVTELDPLVPPTATPTPTVTNTSTPGPTPTFTSTFTPTLSHTPTLAPTNTATTLPSATPTLLPTDTPTGVSTNTAVPSPTPITTIVNSPFGVNLRAEPGLGADVLAFLDDGTTVVLLDQQQEVDGRVWLLVDVNGLVGWLADEFLAANES